MYCHTTSGNGGVAQFILGLAVILSIWGILPIICASEHQRWVPWGPISTWMEASLNQMNRSSLSFLITLTKVKPGYVPFGRRV
jgi:hypothetical protein